MLLHLDQRSQHQLLLLPLLRVLLLSPVNTPQDLSRSSSSINVVPGILSATSSGVKYDSLLMTCRVRVKSHNGSVVVARTLLDSASSVSFVSEYLAQTLGLPRTKTDVVISGIAGITHQSQTHSFTNFEVSPIHLSIKSLSVNAAIVSQVVCELLPHPIYLKIKWDHLADLQLAHQAFGSPGPIDLLLDVDIFVNVVLNSRRYGKPDTQTAFETHFGWVFAGPVQESIVAKSNICPLSMLLYVKSTEDILCKFGRSRTVPCLQKRFPLKNYPLLAILKLITAA